MRVVLCAVLLFALSACADYEVKNLAKSDIDLVADEFISETRFLVRELTAKLYKRNPRELARGQQTSIDNRLQQLLSHEGELLFDELDQRQGIAAMELVFDEAFKGDRVFALVVGLGGMLRHAYGYKNEMFMFDSLNGDALLTSAHNVEVLVWRLKNTRRANGEPFLVTGEYRGVVDNLSFERLFGKIIVLQEMMARIADDSSDRAVTGALHGVVSTVFVPLPL